jgi:hypothetical protein
MIRLELSEEDVPLLREMLDAKLRDLLHERHHTDDRAFRDILARKAALVERLLAALPAGAPEGGRPAIR